MVLSKQLQLCGFCHIREHGGFGMIEYFGGDVEINSRDQRQRKVRVQAETEKEKKTMD